MTINLQLPAKSELLRPTIAVIGVGGAGGNAVNNMIASGLEGVNFVVANTDAQALDAALTDRTIQLGASITKGLGAGANPDVGRASAEEAREEIADYIEGSNMVFITAGMGGGTGTGAASVVARVAKEMGILTVAVVTKPFQFEGAHRMRLAESGLKELQDYVDTLIVIPNQNLFRIANERTTFADAFKMADDVLHSGVRGVTDLMVKPGLINLDFADIRTVMREMGKAMMGTGEATGERRAIEAAEAAISNPLLDDVSLRGARALLINITGGADMTLFEADEAANRIREEVDPDANIIFGSTFSDAMEGKIRVSVVATGIDAQQGFGSNKQAPAATVETKRPYGFTSSPKVEPLKPATRPAAYEAPRSQQPQTEARMSEQRSGGAVSAQREQAQNIQPQIRVQAQAQEEEYDDFEASASPEIRPLLREPASAADPTDIAADLRMAAAGVSPRREHHQPVSAQPAPSHDDSPRGGFFKRMAGVFGGAHEARDEQPERPAVVQKAAVEVTDKSQRMPQSDEQYLDIPAFLRRQAN
ncbi:MAG: cell division protein FtsZ [Alphaproteobacteria bacterium]|nr:cell division protein FtsZ [Alphaproteobacteria bacterium]